MKNKFVRAVCLIAIFIAIDQLLKIVISHLGMGSNVSIIPGVIRFEPIQNFNLTWVFSMAELTPSVAVVVAMIIIAIVITSLLHRYIVFYYAQEELLFDLFRQIAYSGIICALIDVVIWKGSIDYIGLFDWFVFDLKDVYLTCSVVLLLIGTFKNRSEIDRATAKERGIITWLKLGLPKR
ncbi:MAG: signal peptidase II [Lachnospiraceae bacterium]